MEQILKTTTLGEIQIKIERERERKREKERERERVSKWESGADVINKFKDSVHMLCREDGLWLDASSHVTIFNQSEYLHHFYVV